MSKDYYHILGIEKTDDQELIKKAYRQKAKASHPDKSQDPDAQKHFQELNEAYMVLSNPEEKSKYDQGTELPSLSYSEVIEILRSRNEYYWERDSIFRYRSANIYPPTNYEANKRSSRLVNLTITAIALLFLLDLAITGKVNAYEVESVYYVYSGTGNPEDINKYQIFLSNAQVSVHSTEIPAFRGDEAFVSFSLIFAKPKAFISSGGTIHDISGRAFVFWIALLVLIVSLLGLSPILSAERQFNAAVVSGFFSALLIISLLIA